MGIVKRNYKLYVHINKKNGKRYYGITSEKYVCRRWKKGTGYIGNKHFTNAIKKYGWDNFEHIVLFDNLTKEEACLLEQMYIALYNTTNDKYGYNNSVGGEQHKHTNKTKNKMSESKNKPVLCIELYTIFPSSIDASYFFGDSEDLGQKINHCINPHQHSKTAYNLHWRHATQEDLCNPLYEVIQYDYPKIF